METRRVWVPSLVEGWVLGTVIGEEAGKLTVVVDSEERTDTYKASDTFGYREFAILPDMIGLPELHEATLLHNLRLRYMNDDIYTYIGPMVVSVNPYKKLAIYDEKLIPLYQSKPRDELPPHLYSIANKAFQALVQLGQSQSVVISGESGAGKTEATKYVLKFLTTVAATSTSGSKMDLASRILATNPVLEAFGNAKTVRNNNSSRFGKFIKIAFDTTGGIMGSRIDNYLLEQTRIVHQAPIERNYHVFYQLITGASDEEKQKFNLLDSPDEYAYLCNGHMEVEGIDDKADWANLKKAMTTLQISQSDQDAYFSLLSGILHLGNIEFRGVERNGMVEAHVVDEDLIKTVAALFGLEPLAGLLKQSLTTRKVSAGVRSSTASVPFNLEQAIENRDALAKAVYTKLFDNLVLQLNKHLIDGEYPTTSKFIGVLDIYGFEKFTENSLEQFCINYANEKLHNQFNEHIFHAEQMEYKNEGVEWNTIEFVDNKATISLIEGSGGLLTMLDEECKVPKGSDKTYLDKVKQKHKLNSMLQFPMKTPDEFIINHYAEPVNYDVNGFLNKNRDKFSNDVITLMTNSSMPLLKALFRDSATLSSSDDNVTSNRPLRGGMNLSRATSTNSPSKRVDTTVTKKFSTSLAELVTTLASSNRHYVRCLKPNNKAVPKLFLGEKLLGQLRSNGVLETVKLRKAGFANRIITDTFVKRYDILPGLTSSEPKHIRKFLERLVPPKEWAIGHTKVFLRNDGMELLEKKRTEFIAQSLVSIQNHIRSWRAQNKLIKLRIQRERRIAAATVFQKLIRAFYAKRLLIRLILAMKKRRNDAALVIQRYSRSFNSWSVLVVLKEEWLKLQATKAIQAQIRRYCAINRLLDLEEEARFRKAQEELRERYQIAAVIGQRLIRGYNATMKMYRIEYEIEQERKRKEEEERRRIEEERRRREEEERRRREEEERRRREEEERRRREEEERIRREEEERRRREEEERRRREEEDRRRREEEDRRRREEEDRIRREEEERRRIEEERIRKEEEEKRKREEEERIRREAEEKRKREEEEQKRREEEEKRREEEEKEKKKKEEEEKQRLEEDRLRRNRPKTSSRGSTSTKPSLNQDQTRRDRSTDRRGSTIDSARANRRSGQVTEDRRRIEINHHDRIREPSSSRNQAQAISSARGNRGSSSREESRQRSESSRSRSRVNWKTGRDLSNMPYRSQFNNPSSSPTNNYSPPHAPAPIIAPLPINYNPDEDIEEALFRICNRENLKIPPETIEEYASILRSNYLNQLGNVAELDSASWIMLAQQKFPVRLRQLLINEVQNGQKAIKADDRALVAPTTPALASSEVGIGTMLSGLFDGLFGATQPAEPEIPIPNEVIYPNPFEEKSIDLLYQVALMVHLRGDFYDEHPPKNVMAEIAALHCQVMFGDFDDVVLPIEKTLKNPEHESKFFPEGFSDPVLEQRAFDRYKQLTGIPQEQAQLRVVRIIQSLPKNDGVFRFYVSTGSKDSQHSDDSSEDEWILGISAEKVYKMFETENGEEKISSEWDFTKVTRWKYEEHLQLFTIDLIDLQSGLVFVTSEDDGGVISALLFYYLEIFQSKSHQTETTQKVLPTEVDIEVLVYGQQDSTVFSVKVSDTIVQICNNIAKYLKFESDGRFGLKAKSTSEFLVPNKSLNQQDVDFDDLFVFATRLYIPSPLISKQPDYINFLFAECNHFITNNHWAVAKDQAIKLAALQLQSKHGDYNNKTHTPHFFSNSMLQSILPLDWRQPQIIPEVIREYRRLVGTPPSEANLKYVEAVRKLGTFGDTYFEIQMDSHQDLLSVSVNTICHIDGETRGILSDWSFFDVNLCRVDINAEFLTIEFGTGEVFTCASTKALAIERLIMDYISFEAKRKKAPPQQANADDSKCLVM